MLEKYSKEISSSREHLSNAVIAAYINLKDNLSQTEVSFVENHIKECNECKKRLDEMIEEDFEIDDLKGISKENKGTSYYIWAAAAMIIIGLGIGFYYLLLPQEKIFVQNKNHLVDSLYNKDSIGEFNDQQKQVLKDKGYNKSDFAANNVLENFVDRNVRSESKIKLVSPKIGDTLNLPISFKWKEENKNSYIFELVNNKNKLIVSRLLSENKFSYSSELSPGLYYWKLLIDDKLEAVGKFYIK